MTNWAITWYVVGTGVAAAIGWWSVARYLARVRDGQAGRRGVAPDPAQVPLQPRQGPGLTSGERLVLSHLAEAWNTWCRLQGDADVDLEMAGAIHRAQDLVALRVAQRVDPDVWVAGPQRGPQTGAERFKAGARPGSNPPPPAGGKPSTPPAPPEPITIGQLIYHPYSKSVEGARSKALAEDLAALVNAGLLSMSDHMDGPGHMRLDPVKPAPSAPPQATPAADARPSLTVRERRLLSLAASALGRSSVREWLAEPISWEHWAGGRRGERRAGTREDWFAYLLSKHHGPAPTSEPRLTVRELYLMTQVWNRARESSEPRSLGEWLRETTEVPDRVRGGSVTGPLEDALASKVTRVFGAPGQTLEAS